jgi:hypothetical protein
LYQAAFAQNAPVDKELRNLLRRPSMNDALDHVVSVSAEYGRPISRKFLDKILDPRSNAQISGEALHVLKTSLDDYAKLPRNLKEVDRIALKGTIKKFENWRERVMPAYAKAQNEYRKQSLPIHRMEVAQNIRNKTYSSAGEVGGMPIENGSAFTDAMRNSGQLVDDITDGYYTSLRDLYTPSQVKALQNMNKDFGRTMVSKARAKGFNPGEFHDFAVDYPSGVSRLAGGIAQSITPPGVPGYQLGNLLAFQGLEGLGKKAKGQLAERLREPAEILKLLRSPTYKLFGEQTRDEIAKSRIPGLAGYLAGQEFNRYSDK